MNQVPEIRLRKANEDDIRADGDFVLYWMTAFRRTEWNFSLQRAVEWARDLRKPLVVLEALRCGYPWASDRLHHFVIQGMADNARRLRRKPVLFLDKKLARYDGDRNQPEQEVTSGLSPYLHFGHVSVHRIFAEVMQQGEWTPDHIAAKPNGSRQGWWGASPEVESFLDELITWREVGFNMSWQRDDYAQYESLSDWAKKTLADHAKDQRQHVYSLEEFQASETHDELWNAAQRQLVREGRIHNYLRMLWGKKILEWSASPQEAVEIMTELNDRYALDGRNPNSYSGIFWCLGRSALA